MLFIKTKVMDRFVAPIVVYSTSDEAVQHSMRNVRSYNKKTKTRLSSDRNPPSPEFGQQTRKPRRFSYCTDVSKDSVSRERYDGKSDYQKPRILPHNFLISKQAYYMQLRLLFVQQLKHETTHLSLTNCNMRPR